MALNDSGTGDFDAQLENEYMFDAHYPPGTEIGGLSSIQEDRGSGSYAEDGRLEVAEDRIMMDGEDQVGSYAMYGPTEIGSLFSKLAKAVTGAKDASPGGSFPDQGTQTAFLNAVDKSLDALGVALANSNGVNPQQVAEQAQQMVQQLRGHLNARAQWMQQNNMVGAFDFSKRIAPRAPITKGARAGLTATAASTNGSSFPTEGSQSAFLTAVNTVLTDVNSAVSQLATSGPAETLSKQQLEAEIAELQNEISSRQQWMQQNNMVGTHYPTEGASEIGVGPFAEEGAFEIGTHYPTEGASEIGSYAMYGPTEIGAGYFPMDGASEIGVGPFAQEGAFEIGEEGPEDYAHRVGEEGPEEFAHRVGEDTEIQAPFESFMLEPTRVGSGHYPTDGASEIGAIIAVIEKARDNRQPPPPLKAVSENAPPTNFDDWGLTDVVVGATIGLRGVTQPWRVKKRGDSSWITGNPSAIDVGANAAAPTDPFPLLSQLLLRAGAGMSPRYVRVDTEDSYKQFRMNSSPEVADLRQRFEQHLSDPFAHGGGYSDGNSDDNYDNYGFDRDDGLSEDIDELVHLGMEAEAAKKVDLWLPQRYDGLVSAWREGDHVCASITLPGQDGDVRICTSLEPIVKCVTEMSRHASEANVAASSVVGSLPAMGCALGAGTAIKEMAAAAPSILSQPQAATKTPFIVRVEPKVNPALAALAMLACACQQGNAQACDEWQRLGAASPAPLQQAMVEALQLVQSAAMTAA